MFVDMVTLPVAPGSGLAPAIKGRSVSGLDLFVCVSFPSSSIISWVDPSVTGEIDSSVTDMTPLPAARVGAFADDVDAVSSALDELLALSLVESFDWVPLDVPSHLIMWTTNKLTNNPKKVNGLQTKKKLI